jgi:hypothetical protein
MGRKQLFLTIILSNLFTIAIIAGSMLVLSRALAAPPAQVATGNLGFTSVSALAFTPLSSEARYRKDGSRQLLALDSQTRSFAANTNLFTAPLMLPDGTILTGMTMFGEDFDSQGEVRLRLKRCDHGQGRCISLAELTSSTNYATGQFETIKLGISNEVVNHNLYTYVLELELTALANSGLRSVRLDLIDRGGSGSAPGAAAEWSLSGSVFIFPVPNLGYSQVRACTNDLSHLDNSTHYPFLVVDGRTIQLASNSCVTEWGEDIEIRRRLNTGPSSGTYQVLR